MKTHQNARKLVAWMEEHGVATAPQVAASGLMTASVASDAFAYGVHQGVFEKLPDTGRGGTGRGRYRLTGQPLPVLKAEPPVPSFDELLDAWRIPRKPPQGAAPVSSQVERDD
jgi:hypothetical protein